MTKAAAAARHSVLRRDARARRGAAWRVVPLACIEPSIWLLLMVPLGVKVQVRRSTTSR
jgi:hypothetical protein